MWPHLKLGNAGRNRRSTRGASRKNCICTAVLQVWLAQPAKGSMLFIKAKLAHRRRGQLPGLKGSTSANARLRANLKREKQPFAASNADILKQSCLESSKVEGGP